MQATLSNQVSGLVQLTRWQETIPFVVPLTLMGALMALQTAGDGQGVDLRLLAVMAANILVVTYAFMINDIEDAPDDARDPAGVAARVAEIIRAKDAATWVAIFEAADCCCSIVQDVRAALSDEHFRARGVFAHVLANGRGERMPALPVPVDGMFRADPGSALTAPFLGANNAEFGF